MDITLDNRDLKAALTIANRAVVKGNYALPALSGVLLRATDDGRLHLVTSDLDVTVLHNIASVVNEPGTSLVPARLLMDTVRKAKGQTQLLSHDDSSMEVVNGTSTSIRTLPHEEFLRLAGPLDSESFPLDLTDVAEVIAAASKDQARPILTGVLLSKDRMVATDSYRLHLHVGTTDYPTALIPSRALAQVIAAKPKGPVSIQFGDGEVRITAGDTQWIVRTIVGEFPNYPQLIPTNPPYLATVDRAGFASLVAAVGKMAKQAEPIRLTFEATKLTLTVTSRDVGESSGSMACTATLHGDPLADAMTVAYNPAFLLDTATVGQGDTLTLAFTDALKPTLVSDERGAEVTVRLIMPVRVS